MWYPINAYSCSDLTLRHLKAYQLTFLCRYSKIHPHRTSYSWHLSCVFSPNFLYYWTGVSLEWMFLSFHLVHALYTLMFFSSLHVDSRVKTIFPLDAALVPWVCVSYKNSFSFHAWHLYLIKFYFFISILYITWDSGFWG